MLRSIFICLFLFAALPLAAKDFQWVSGGVGDHMTFSDAGNWYDLDPAADPHNPSGPPAGNDNADLGSSATVISSGGSVKKLTGSGTSMLTLSGPFTVQEFASALTLAGAGLLTAQLVSAGPHIVGGNLTAESYTGRSLSVESSGALTIKSDIKPSAAGDSFLINATSGSMLDVEGTGFDVEGSVEGGAQATLTRIENRTVSKLTLDISGAGSSLSIGESCFIRDGSLDVSGGATVNVTDLLQLEGARVDGQELTATSHWKGAGTHVTVGSNFRIGFNAGIHSLVMGAGAVLTTQYSAAIGTRGGEGKVSLSDAGTRWDVEGNALTLGNFAPGSLEILDGAAVVLAADASLAVGQGVRGSVVVDGTNSLLNAQGHFCTMGYLPKSHGEVTVSNGGRFVAGSDFVVGVNGDGVLSVASGGILQLINDAFVTHVGKFDTATGTVTVTGATTQAHLGLLFAGLEGKANVSVSSGAAVATRGLIIADLKPSVANVTISSGATWVNDTATSVGGNAPAGPPGVATLSVLDSASFSTGSSLFVAAGSTMKVSPGGSALAGTGGYGPPGSLRVGNGGTLSGKGKVLAQVINGLGGKVEPGASPGTLIIDGDYTQESGGTLNIELGGTGAKSDLLKISGNAILDGTINVTLANGFNPKAGQKFKVLTSKKRTGTFAQTNGVDQIEYTADGFTVSPLVPHTTLHVAVNPGAPNPGGEVSAGFLGDSDRVLGFTYTIVAKPAADFVFSGWTGDLTSTNPSLTFAVTDNMMLQANFVGPDPFAAQILGTYDGVATTSDDDEIPAAQIHLKLNKSGAFSAKITLGGKAYSFSGVFTGLGRFQRQLTINKRLFDIDLTAALDNSGTVTGTITINGVTYTATTLRGTFTTAQPTDRAGVYTILFPPNADNSDFLAPRPQGNGWASVKIRPTGVVKLTGQLADSLKISAGGTLAPDGSVALVANLYKSQGVFAGALTFAAPPRNPDPMVSDVTGTMTWTKPVDVKNQVFPGSFATTLDALGSFFDLPAKDERVLTGLDANGDARLRFLGGDLDADLTKDLIISTKNAVTYPAPTSRADRLKLNFTTKTGTFAGSFLHPGTGKAKVFTGVVLRKQKRGAGSFLDATDSGQVELAAP